MTGRASRRAVGAMACALLALAAALFPTVASLPFRSPHAPMEHAVASQPFRAAVAQPAAPVVRSAPILHRLIGFAVPAAGSPATPSALLSAALGLSAVAGTAGRSRRGGDRRRPRGPPAPQPASVA